jgi:hypothetical protein
MDSSHHRQHKVSAELLWASDLVIAQHKVSAELLWASDLVIAMSTDHQTFLLDACQYRVPLFNEVRHGRSEPLLDVWEAVPAWETDPNAARYHTFQAMEHI